MTRCTIHLISLALVGAILAGCTAAQPSATHSGNPKLGLLPSNPQIETRIELASTRVAAGSTIHGTLVITSHALSPINLTKICRPQYGVGLTNAKIQPQGVAFFDSCVEAPFVIPPGITRLAITVPTTYQECAQTNQTPSLPRCAKKGMPPLPTGRYKAVLVGDGLPLPEPTPVTVTLTSRG